MCRVTFAAAVVIAACHIAATSQGRLPAVALVGGRIFSSATAATTENATIVIDGGRITAVGRPESVRIPAGAQVVACDASSS